MKTVVKSLAFSVLITGISFCCFGQADSLKVPSVSEKAAAILSRMQRDLGLSDAQALKVNGVLLQRFNDISSTTGGQNDPFANANSKAMTKLSKILTASQYSNLVAIHTDTARQKAEFMKKNPSFAYSKQDKELDF